MLKCTWFHNQNEWQRKENWNDNKKWNENMNRKTKKEKKRKKRYRKIYIDGQWKLSLVKPVVHIILFDFVCQFILFGISFFIILNFSFAVVVVVADFLFSSRMSSVVSFLVILNKNVHKKGTKLQRRRGKKWQTFIFSLHSVFQFFELIYINIHAAHTYGLFEIPVFGPGPVPVPEYTYT